MRTRRSQSSGDPMSLPLDIAQGKGHRTVLLHEAVDSLDIQKNDVVVDGTLGGAGHSVEILKHLGTHGTLIGFDADKEAIERSKIALEGAKAAVHFVNTNFRHLKTELETRGLGRIDKALFDLGWSSYQLDAGRGFSFQKDEPLSMAYAADQALDAFEIVNQWGEQSIADIIFGWGEERYSRRIAKGIVLAREKKPIRTSGELAEVVRSSVPAAYRFGRIHPATKTFQALRIAVNDELGALSDGLNAAWELLRPGGRIAVISFHSIEDRIVKRQFVAWAASENGIRITKKPIVAGEEELRTNPRARSAKLRVVQKKSI